MSRHFVIISLYFLKSPVRQPIPISSGGDKFGEVPGIFQSVLLNVRERCIQAHSTTGILKQGTTAAK